MQRFLILASLVALLLGLNGCTALKSREQGPINRNGASNNSEVDTGIRPPKQFSKQKIATSNVESQLLAAAQSIEESLNTLAAAEKAESAPILNTEQLITPEGGMGGTADVDWTGPIGPLVEKIARLTHYHVKVLGNEPAIPILVSIKTKRGVIADILQNASFQAGKRAHILVFPNEHVIEVRYLS